MKRTLKLELLFVALLLCGFAQGALAQNFDVWDGVSEEKPGTYGACIQIKSAAQMAWVMNHYTADVGKQNPYRASIDICTDIDMTAGVWKPLGSEEKLYYKPEPWVSSVTCNGLGHTVKIRIDNGTSDNYQGLFYGIGEDGKVKNLHVDCNIVVGNARFVGGICGENDGTIENCWVSGHIESSHYSQYDADLGGIAGLNDDGIIKYCCVTADVTNTGGNYGVGGIAGSNDGTIRHVTFTGSVSVNHSQDNKWVGDQDKTLEYNYDSFNQSEYDAASGYDTYCRILKYKGLPSITINNAGDWNEMAEYVNYGCTLSGSYVTLNNNISVSTMMGSSEDNSFQGTFDGDGHTLTLNVSNQARFASPFKYVKGATIKNLKTAGSISGTGNADGKLLAGIVGHCMGNTTITNCVSSMALTTDYDNDAAMAGLVAATRGGSLTISGCVFNGSMAGGANSGRCAGISGYEYIATTTSITNTLFAPTSLTVPVDEYTRTFTRDADATITNCYYTQTLGTAQGTQTIALTTAPGNLGNLVKDYGMVKAYENGILFDGKYYAFTLSGTGTDANPYIIGNAGQWDDFANYVTNGISFSGTFVKLTSDISVSTMAGIDDANSFQGTFDGDGHTLTFTKGSSDSPFTENYCAPLRHVKNAVIKNLHTAGTITTSAMKGAGLVGESHGALTITGCRSSVAINSSKSGDGTHGGFVATLSGANNSITIEGCVFDGSFASTSGTNGCGGFIGWPVYNKPVIRNSLMIPGNVAAGMLGGTFARWHNGYEPTIEGCYFIDTDNLPADQGTKAVALAAAPGNLGDLVKDYGMLKAYQNGLLFDGKYYVNADLGLSDNTDNGSAISEYNGATVDVTLTGCTLYKDGAWNTICLPFNLTLAGSPLDGAVARPLTGASISGSTLNLTFGDAATELKAGTPYIIKWASGDNIVNPKFDGVTIDATDRSFDNGAKGDERVRFIGVYKSIAFDGEDKSVLLLGGANTLYHPVSGAGVGALRAYFKIGDSATKATVSVKGSVLMVK